MSTLRILYALLQQPTRRKEIRTHSPYGVGHAVHTTACRVFYLTIIARVRGSRPEDTLTSNQSIMSGNQLKSEAEAQFAKERGVEPEYKPIPWFTQWQINRFLLYVFFSLLLFLVGTGIQCLSFSIGPAGVILTGALPKFEQYTAFNWALQWAWWVVLLIGAFFGVFAISNADKWGDTE